VFHSGVLIFQELLRKLAGEVPKNLRERKIWFLRCCSSYDLVGLANGPCAILLKLLNRAIVGANQTLQSLLDLDTQVAKAADLIEESLRPGNKLLVCGTGGSAADASHSQQSLRCALRKIAQRIRRDATLNCQRPKLIKIDLSVWHVTVKES
jgi:hypothetical protein